MDHSNPTTGPAAAFRTAVCAVFACAALVVAVRHRDSVRLGRPAPATFVDRALGSPSPDASLERRLATGATLAVDRHGLNATSAGDDRARVAQRGQRQAGSATERRHAHHELRERVDPLRDQPAEQFLTVEHRQGTRTWSWQLDATHGTPRIDPNGGVSFARAGQPRRLPHPPGRDPRPATAATSRRPACTGHSTRARLRLDARPATRRRDAAGAVPDRPDRADRRLRPRRPARAARRAAPRPRRPVRRASGSRSPRRRSAATCWSRSSPSARPARSRRRPAGARSARRRRTPTARSSRPSSGTSSTARSRRRSRSRGRAATPTRPAARHVQGRRPVHRLRPGRERRDLDVERRHRRDRQPRRPRHHDLGRERDAAGRLRRRERRHRHADRRPGPRPRVDRLLHRRRRRSQPASPTASRQRQARRATRPRRGSRAHSGSRTSSRSRTKRPTAREPSRPPSRPRRPRRPGLTQTLTYTPAAGSMANGDVSFVVPVGWTAPQATTPSAAGYVTATGGSGTNTIAVTGTGPWTVTVSGVTLNQGAAQTLVIKYGDTSGGGTGATATATTGAVVWTTKQRSSSRGALTNARGLSRRSPSTRPTDRHGRVEPLGRLRLAGRADRDAHLHGTGRRPLERDAHRRGAGRLDSARDRRPGPGFTTSIGRSGLRRGADDHRHRRHAHRGPDRGDHIRLRRDGDRGRRPGRTELAGQGGLDRGRRPDRDRRRRRRSRSTHPTARERRRHRPRTSPRRRPATPSSSPTPSRPATCRTAASS